MIKINLLPHREAKRKQAIQEFYALLGAGAIAGVVIVLTVGAYLSRMVTIQSDRNDAISAEITVLDGKIREIATLKEEIEALKARQEAVENLQGDRNQPVYLMDALVKQTPEGIYLRGIKQDGQRVVVSGYAQSNERVADFLRNLSNNSEWLERPDLIGIRSMAMEKQKRKVFDFTVSVGIKRKREEDDEKEGKDGKAAGAVASSAPKT